MKGYVLNVALHTSNTIFCQPKLILIVYVFQPRMQNHVMLMAKFTKMVKNSSPTVLYSVTAKMATMPVHHCVHMKRENHQVFNAGIPDLSLG